MLGTDNMPRVKLPKSEIEKQLRHQISFLISSCKLYDEGCHAEAKRLATSLRILFHETRKSKSLLGQLRLKNISWLDSSSPYDPENQVSHVGLTKIKFTPGRIPCLIPKGLPQKKVRIEFNKWWSNPVIVAVAGIDKIFFSRQNIVLNVADTDGGAHVDPEIEDVYNEISRKNGVGFNAIVDSTKYPMLYPEMPCLRQIAHEVLLSLFENAPYYFEQKYNEEIPFIPFGPVVDDSDPSVKIIVKIYIRKKGA